MLTFKLFVYFSAEAEEFDVYEKYARDILSPKSRHTLDNLLPRQIVSDALRYSAHHL